MTCTHTYVELDISPAAYDEIRMKLEAADYGHCFMDDGTIDMHGLGLVRQVMGEDLLRGRSLDKFIDQATVIFDNDPASRETVHRTPSNPPMPVCGITSGRNEQHQLNGTITHEDLKRMVDQIKFNGDLHPGSQLVFVVPPNSEIVFEGIPSIPSSLMRIDLTYGNILLMDLSRKDCKAAFQGSMIAKRVTINKKPHRTS